MLINDQHVNGKSTNAMKESLLEKKTILDNLPQSNGPYNLWIYFYYFTNYEHYDEFIAYETIIQYTCT